MSQETYSYFPMKHNTRKNKVFLRFSSSGYQVLRDNDGEVGGNASGARAAFRGYVLLLKYIFSQILG